MNADALAAAERGAALLDEKVPHWAEDIDLDRLNMSVGGWYLDIRQDCGCVLAQLDARTDREAQLSRYGSFSAMRDRLGLTMVTACDYGFDRESTFTFSELDEAWKHVIEERLEVVGW